MHHTPLLLLSSGCQAPLGNPFPRPAIDLHLVTKRRLVTSYPAIHGLRSGASQPECELTFVD